MAAQNLERFDQQVRESRQTLAGRSLVLMSLTYMTIEDMASDNGVLQMQDKFDMVNRANAQHSIS
jgi:hypothetical protein